jgi:hypothetical protein
MISFAIDLPSWWVFDTVNLPAADNGHEDVRKVAMAAERAAEQTIDPVRRMRTPAGDPAWQVDGYREIKELLTDPRLGRSHPQPEQAARYSECGFIGQPSGSDPEPSGLSTPGFGGC